MVPLDFPHFAVSRGDVHSLVRSAPKEAIERGLRISGIASGVVDNPMTRRSGECFDDDIAPVCRR